MISKISEINFKCLRTTEKLIVKIRPENRYVTCRESCGSSEYIHIVISIADLWGLIGLEEEWVYKQKILENFDRRFF
jgi:hypothetical protein